MAKRQRKGGDDSPKKRKLDVKAVGAQIIESPKNYNELTKLLQLPLSSVLIGTLRKVFRALIKAGELSLAKDSSEQHLTVARWLQSKYKQFLDKIYELWGEDSSDDTKTALQIQGLHAVMKLVEAESEFLGPVKGEAYFATKTYNSALKALLCSGSESAVGKNCAIDNPLVAEFHDKYMDKWDMKFFLLEYLKDNDEESRLLFCNVLALVKKSPICTGEEEEMEETLVKNPPPKILSRDKFKINFQTAWTKLMRWSGEYKPILLVLHKRILPYLANPPQLMDFLTDAYNQGLEQKDVSMSILALNSLWHLMSTYNLEYPHFYTNLYAILTPDLLHLGYRNRFLRLLDLFMTSTHLSALIVASFIKRLSRLALTAPTPAVVAVIPFVYNLLKRHPTCMLLVHNTSVTGEYEDPFDMSESDPAKTNAIDSSVWELETMMKHYHPQVASLAKILSQPFSKDSYNMEDFLDWSYRRLADTEIQKKFKGDLSMDYEEWPKMFGEGGYMDGFTL